MRGAAHLTDSVIHVRAERLSSAIAIEERREHPLWKSRRNEQSILTQRVQDHFSNLPRCRVVFRELRVVLRSPRLVARCYAAIHPIGCFENTASLRYLLAG